MLVGRGSGGVGTAGWSASYQIPSYIQSSLNTPAALSCFTLLALPCLPALSALANLAAQSIEGVLTIA